MLPSDLSLVYVLTCSGRNRFAVMAYVAVSALLRITPHARTHLLCDPISKDSLEREFPLLLEKFVEISVLDSESPDLKLRSRKLKANLRNIVQGDFIYLDIDTLPIAPFDEMIGDWDFAAAQDRNHHCPIIPCFPHWRIDDYDQLGWPHPPKLFNSGVFFMRDNATTREVGQCWTRRWQELFKVGREDDDQFALTTACYDVPSLRIQELDTRFNAMVSAHPIHARRAKILHFFAGNTAGHGQTLFDYLVQHCMETGQIDWAAYERCVAMEHPWMPPYWPKRFWQAKQYGQALRFWLTNRLARTSA